MTPDQARRRALEKGSALSIEGEHFNTAHERVPVRPTAAPVESHEAPQVAAPAQVDLLPLIDAIRQSHGALAEVLTATQRDDAMARALEALARSLGASRPRCRWRFKITRDANNLIEDIVAIPLEK